MRTTIPRPTPEVNSHQDDMYRCEFDEELALTYELAKRLECERDEAREQLEAMREAINEAARVIENARFVHQAITTYAPQDAVDKIENQKHCDNMSAALAKLSEFIDKPNKIG